MWANHGASLAAQRTKIIVQPPESIKGDAAYQAFVGKEWRSRWNPLVARLEQSKSYAEIKATLSAATCEWAPMFDHFIYDPFDYDKAQFDSFKSKFVSMMRAIDTKAPNIKGFSQKSNAMLVHTGLIQCDHVAARSGNEAHSGAPAYLHKQIMIHELSHGIHFGIWSGQFEMKAGSHHFGFLDEALADIIAQTFVNDPCFNRDRSNGTCRRDMRLMGQPLATALIVDGEPHRDAAPLRAFMWSLFTEIGPERFNDRLYSAIFGMGQYLKGIETLEQSRLPHAFDEMRLRVQKGHPVGAHLLELLFADDVVSESCKKREQIT